MEGGVRLRTCIQAYKVYYLRLKPAKAVSAGGSFGFSCHR